MCCSVSDAMFVILPPAGFPSSMVSPIPPQLERAGQRFCGVQDIEWLSTFRETFWPTELRLAPVLRRRPSHGDLRHRTYQTHAAWHLPYLLDTAWLRVPLAKRRWVSVSCGLAPTAPAESP